MGSMYYAYMFPSAGQQLCPANLIRILADQGFAFDSSAYVGAAVDAIGHIAFGDEVKLGDRPDDELASRIIKGEQCQVQCSDADLFLIVSFVQQSWNPHLVIGWPRRLFSALPQERQQAHWRLLRGVAAASKASFLIVVIDPPGYFEDRFIELDGRRILDRERADGLEVEIQEIWIRADVVDAIPEGVHGPPKGDIEEGFQEYPLLR